MPRGQSSPSADSDFSCREASQTPSDVSSLDTVAAPSIGIVSVKAPEQTARALDIIDSSEDGAIEKFAAALKAAL